jgi:hypothetical protein
MKASAVIGELDVLEIEKPITVVCVADGQVYNVLPVVVRSLVRKFLKVLAIINPMQSQELQQFQQGQLAN